MISVRIPFHPSFLSVILAGVLLCTPVAMADTPRSAPLHIKVGSAKEKLSGIRIHKGQIPIVSPVKITSASKGNAVRMRSSVVDDPIDAAISCAMNRSAPMGENRMQNLSDSLKDYMRAEKLDYHLIDTLQRAARETNTDFELLVAKAMLESDLGRQMKSPVSTARGVFQYVEMTWLSLMDRYGAKIGYPHYAEAIDIHAESGQPFIKKSSAVTRSEILDLRFNPYAAALIKGYQIQDESPLMKTFKDSQKLSATDHYIAHMMGLSLAEEFYKLKNEESGVILAHSSNPLFREAVALNRPFFYDTQGRAMTAPEAYQNFKTRIAKTYERLRKIEAQYGKSPVADACGISAPAMPAVEAAKVEKPEMLPAKGLAMASLQTSSLKTSD